jgi:hypothetical protein
MRPRQIHKKQIKNYEVSFPKDLKLNVNIERKKNSYDKDNFTKNKLKK